MIKKIPLRISNAYLLTGAQPILIDTGLPGEENTIISALQKYGYQLQDIALIIHTHAHIDHAGSTSALKKMADIPLLVHRMDAALLKAGSNGNVYAHSFMGSFIKKMVIKNYTGIAADVVFDESFSLEPYGIEGKIIHTPGHTSGSCSVILQNEIAIVGDVFMGGYGGGYILPSICTYHYFIQNKKELHHSIQSLLNTGANMFYCGHGGPINRQAVLKKFGNKQEDLF